MPTIGLASGNNHSLAVLSDGTVWAWGRNNQGQLGQNTTDASNHSTPLQVLGAGGSGFLTGVSAVAAGSSWSMALKSDGTVWAWGVGTSGQMGNGSGASSLAPVQVSGLTSVTKISAGDTFGYALKSDGTLWSWGANQNGKLGIGSTAQQNSPVQVHGAGNVGFLTSVAGMAAGVDNGIAYLTDGSVYVWGLGTSGQLGNGGTSSSTFPVLNTTVSNITAVCLGGGVADHALALASDGTVWGWGYGGHNQLGRNAIVDTNSTPAQVHGAGNIGVLSGVAAITCPGWESYALKTDGTVWAWGYGTDGAMGDGSTNDNAVPDQVVGVGGSGFLTGITSLGIGSGSVAEHILALKSSADVIVYAWGFNSNGQLGNGITAGTSSSTPVTVPALNTIDITAPTVTGVTSSLANGSYKAGQVIPINVNFSEAVNVTGTPQLTLSTGSPATTAVNYTSGSGTSTLTFNYTVSSGNTSSDLDYASTTALALNGGTIKDQAGTPNNAVLTLAAPGAAGSLGANKNLVIDTTAPVISGATPASNAFIKSITASSAVSYTLSESIASGSIVMTRTSGTTDAGSPHTCTLKGTALNAGLHNALNLSDTTNACTAAQSLVDGAVYTFTFNGTDAAGNTASAVSSTQVTFDTTAPVISAVAPASNASINNITTSSAVSYTLSEAIASGSIVMTRTGGTLDGSSPRTCTLKGNALTAGAHTALNLSDTTNACTAAQSLVDGAVYTFAFNATDAAGNAATAVSSTLVTFDSSSPSVSGVTASNANGSYVVGSVIHVQVNFSENVTVTGTPTLTLATGNPATTAVNYTSGSGTSTLLFDYTVANGNTSADLDYAATNSLSLNGGTIKDGAGNNAVLTLAAPGTAGSLGANKDIVIANPVPTTTSISPTTKTAGDATFTLTVNGTNFVPSSVVNFDGSPLTTTFVSATQLTADVPAASITTGASVSITVFNPAPGGGTSNAQTLTVNNPLPTTTSISPASKLVGADTFTLTVNGTGFVSTSLVKFEGSVRSTTYVSATQLTATIPATDLATTGNYSITVFSPTPGGGTSNAQTLTVENPLPVITSISPTSAYNGSPDLTLTVTGSSFVGSSVVRFDGADLVTTFGGATQLTATIPAADMTATGVHNVTVFSPTPGGGETAIANFTVNDLPLPTTTSISPISKGAGDSTFTLTVDGTNFVDGFSVVRFDGSDLATTFVSGTELTASVPGSLITANGTYSITVFNPAPGGGTSNAQTLTVNNPLPTTTSLSPGSEIAGSAGFVLTVNGTNFVSDSVVRWNGNDRVTTYVSATQVTAAITVADIATAGTADVTVFNDVPGGGESNAQTFTVNNPVPAITSLSPDNKTAGDADFTLTVNGTGFVDGSSVKWEGSARTTTYVSPTQLTASITAADIATAGTFSVTVFNDVPGGGTSGAATFTVNNPVPTTTSVSGPTLHVGQGDQVLTVDGTNFVTSSVVRWNGNDRATSYVSATQLTFTVLEADQSSTGDNSVTVFNPTPGGGESNVQTVSVTFALPALTSVSPDSATAGDSGFTLTLNGTGFTSSTVARWSGSDRVTTFVNTTQMTAAITAADIATAGTFDVTVFNPAPGGGESGAKTFTVNNPVPTTTSLSPDSATAGDAAFTLTVNGTNFVASSVVRWDGSDRTTTFVSSTQVTASIPATDIATAGTYTVKVFNPTPGGGLSNGQTFTVNNPVPTTTSVTGGTLHVGQADTPLTVNGTGFNTSSVARWNGSDRSTTYVSATQLSFTVLASDQSATGDNSVTVFNPTPGGGESNAQTVTVNNPLPTVSGISPTSATAGDPGFTLTVNGTNFVGGSVVRWNGSDRVTTYVSGTQITAAITAGDIATAGTADVTVFNGMPGGGESSAATFTINNPIPTTTSLSPNSATAGDSAFTLTVNGTNFVASSVVRWDGSDRTTTFVSSTQVTASIPATDIDTAGTSTVTVFNPTPGGALSGGQTFTINNPAPTTSTISPTQVATGSGALTLTVNGTGFNNQSVVRFDGSDRATTFVSATQVTADLSSSDTSVAGNFSITVFSPVPGGGTSGAMTFAVVDTPAVGSLTHTPASPNTNDAVTLDASATDGIGVAKIDIYLDGTTPADLKKECLSGPGQTSASCSINVGTLAAGSHTTTAIATNDNGFSGTQTDTFSVVLANAVPTTSSISPSSATEGDPTFNVVVSGTNFLVTSVVRWNGADLPTTYISSTQINGSVDASLIAAAGTADVTVFNPTPGGGESNAQTFTINATPTNPVPTTTSLSPSSATEGDPSFTLTVNGTDFVASSVVRWNGSDRTTTYVSSTQVTAAIDAADIATNGSASVKVFNPAPGGGESNAQTFTIDVAPATPPPTITSLSPSSKTAGAAAFTLTVNGTGYAADSVVRWNGNDRVTTFVSATQVTAAIPGTDVASAGTASVTVNTPAPGGGESAPKTFTINSPPSGGGASAHIPTSVTVSSPNGGETVYSGEDKMILFSAQGSDVQSVTISLSKDSGQTYADVIATQVYPNNGYYNWSVPADLTAFNARVRVSAYGQGGSLLLSDDSNADFIIQPKEPPPEEPPLAVIDTSLDSVTFKWSAALALDTTGLYALHEDTTGQWVVPTTQPLAAAQPPRLLSGVASKSLAQSLFYPGTWSLLASQGGYKLGPQPHYQTISDWGVTFSVSELAHGTKYKMSIYYQASPNEPGVNTWTLDASTDKEIRTFDVVKKLVGKMGGLIKAPNGTEGPGVTLTYTIDITNTGNVPQQVTLIDPLADEVFLHPGSLGVDGTGLTEAEDDDIGSYKAETNEAKWVWPIMQPTEHHQVTLKSDEIGGDGSDVLNTYDVSFCGDGFTDSPEQCDEGELNGTPGHCSSSCMLCGNGVLDTAVQESCDNGAQNGVKCTTENGGSCTYCDNKCKTVVESCGNGILEPGEACDLGSNTGKLCTPAAGSSCTYCSGICQFAENYCGNSTVDADKGENCDVGKDNGNVCKPEAGAGTCTYCSAKCLLTVNPCGNGVKDSGEDCDDGLKNGIACTAAPGSTCNYCSTQCKTVSASCGNGALDPGETCDAGMLNGRLCSPPAGGSCNYCSSSCQVTPNSCGNTKLDSGEECDEGKQNGILCKPEPGAGTCNYCSSSCKVTVNLCGNGVKDKGEACDDGLKNGAACEAPIGGSCDYCSTSCQVITDTCGDSKVDPGETCDSGTNFNGKLCSPPAGGSCNYCSAQCQLTPNSCGNGNIDGEEQCDAGKSNGVMCVPPLGGGTCTFCDTSCKQALNPCGNGVKDKGEECDTGALNGISCQASEGEACTYCGQTCKLITNTCGDSKVDPGETCDAGSTNNGKLCSPPDGGSCNYCSTSCQTTANTCGNTVVDSGEDCDAGKQNGIKCVPPLGGGTCTYCSASCKLTVNPCGNGTLDKGEECDDGDKNGVQCDKDAGGTCTYCGQTCKVESNECGNGTLGKGEQCDLGRGVNGRICKPPVGGSCTFCSTSCQMATNTCGNAKLEAGEDCDTGAKNGQACTPEEGSSCAYCSATCHVMESFGDPGALASTVIRLPKGHHRTKYTVVSPPNEEEPGAKPKSPNANEPEEAPPGGHIYVPVPGNDKSGTDRFPIITGHTNPGGHVIVSIDGGRSVLLKADKNGDWSLALTNPLSVGEHTIDEYDVPAMVYYALLVSQLMPVVAAANIVVAVGVTNVFYWLMLLFTQPVLLLDRRGRKPYGVVYDSLTKLPLELAVIRLRDKATSRIMGTKVTDPRGRYNFLVKPGQYQLEIAKAGYVFPTEYMRGKTEDVGYLDLLTDKEFQTASDLLLTRNIPADPDKKERAPWRVTFERAKRFIQHLVALSGPLVSLYAFIVQPTALSFVLCVVMFLLYGFFGLFTKKRRPKSTATITDAATGRPIAGAYVRIFDARFNKLLETQITDRKGRYAFLVGRSRYYVTASKPGYVEERSAIIDLTGDQFVPFVAVNMALRVGQTAPPPSSPASPPPVAEQTPSTPPTEQNENPQ